MNRKRLIWLGSSSLAILLLVLLFTGKSGEELVNLEAEVKKGPFVVEVTTTGELMAEKSTKVMGPAGLQKIRVWNVKIENIIPDGTLVDSGDYVATLDKTEATENLKDVEAEVESSQNSYNNAILDTTLELRGLRDNLVNLKFSLEEAKIKLEQSRFEPPATIRQEEINLSKAERSYEQTLENYKIKVEQAKAKMLEASLKLEKSKRNRENIQKVLDEFEIKAPKSGMLNYRKDWRGNKVKAGSSISAWDPVVAELPDLSQMNSKTFINEIDISKIKSGQKVTIGVDAFPELKFTGEVTSVANMGEQLPTGNAKVFEVLIKLEQTDTVLKPSMTTANRILIEEFENVTYVPIESVFANDTISWVFKKNGLSITKQQVTTGASNELSVIVTNGLEVGEKVLLNMPENATELPLKPIN